MELKTPLYDVHIAEGGKIVPFAGYLLPVQYAGGVIKEHMAVRQAAGLFDVDHRIIGQNVGGVVVTPIADMKDVIRKEGIQIGIITTPAAVAQQVADQMVEAGIQGIFSCAPLRLTVPDNIFVFREDLSIGLSRISYYLTNKKED